MKGCGIIAARRCVACVLAAWALSSVHAADISWSNAAGGRWGDAANWTGGVVPGASDTAIITLAVTVEVDDIRSVGGLSLASDSTLLIRGNGARGNALLNLSGIGTNQGTIQLDSSHSSYSGGLAVGSGGLLNVAPGARIELLRTFANGRGLTGTIRNQGVIYADPGYDATPNLINFSGGQYIADGGVLEGALYAVSREIQTLSSPAAPSTIRVAHISCSLTSDIEAGYTIEVLGTGNWGNGLLTIPASVANRGTIRLGSTSSSYSSQVAVTGQSVTNAVGGTLTFAAGLRMDRYFSGNLINDGLVVVDAATTAVLNGSIEQRGGSIVANGRWQHDSGTFTFTGGSTSGNVYCSGVAIDIKSTVTDISSLLAEGTNTLMRNDSPVVTLTNQGNDATGNASLRVVADAVNRGTIRLDSTSGSYWSQLIADAPATFSNDDGASIEFVSGAGQSRFLNGNLVNRGEIIAEAAFDTAPSRIDVSGGTYVADGGVLSGAIYLRGKAVSTTQSPTAPSTILLAAMSNSLVSDIVSGYTLEILGTGYWGNGRLNVEAGFENHGTLRVGSTSASYWGQIFATGQTITNAPNGSLVFASGARFDRYLNGNLINLGSVLVESGVTAFVNGAVSQNGGSIVASGRWQHDSSTFTFIGGTTSGNVYCSGVTIDIQNTVTNASTLLSEGTNTLVQNDSPVVTLTNEGNVNTGNASLHVAEDAVNRGTIRLDSTTASYWSQLIADPPATLTNEAGATIAFISGSGQNRYLNGDLVNRGQITAEAAFDAGPQRIDLSGGAYVADGGVLVGTIYLRNKAVSMTQPPPAPSVILTGGGANSLLSDVVANYELRVMATDSFGNGILQVPAGVTNRGLLLLGTISASYHAQVLIAAGQMLTNGPTGIVRAAAGPRADRYLSGPLRNEGIVHVDAGVLLNSGALTQTDTGAYEVELAGTPVSQVSRWAVAGNADLDGKLRITRISGFLPVIGDRFQIMTFNSFSDRFSCDDIEGIFIQGDHRFSLERNPTNLTLEVVDSAILPTDPDCDCEIDLTDLANVLVNFGTPTGMQLADGDFNGDGAVDLTDLALLLSNFGLACP